MNVATSHRNSTLRGIAMEAHRLAMMRSGSLRCVVIAGHDHGGVVTELCLEFEELGHSDVEVMLEEANGVFRLIRVELS